MNNEKILNLTDVEDNDFEAIKGAIEDWMESGSAGNFTFLPERLLKGSYDEGVWHGGLAVIGGILTGTAIYFVLDHFITKKEIDKL